jgi:glucose/arabinose dehydrogenase
LLSATIAVQLVTVAASPGATAPARATAAAQSGFSEQPVFTGLDHPTNVAFAADSRVFVAEKSGLIKVFDSLDDPTPSAPAASGGRRGRTAASSTSPPTAA